nr:hypothetical protein [Tanacetum cinerariifolium]
MQQATRKTSQTYFYRKDLHGPMTSNKFSRRLQVGHLKTIEVRESQGDPGCSHGVQMMEYCMCEIQIVMRKKVNSGYVVDNVLMGCGGAYEVNSHAKIQSYKTRNSNKPVDQKSHTQKPDRQIFTGHRFSPNKTSAMYEKTSPRSDLRWKPTDRIFKSVSLRWIPTGKLFDSCTSTVDIEPPHGSSVDIPNIHECKQTLDVSAGTSINVQKEQSIDLIAGTLCNVNKENLRVWLMKKMIS